MSGGIAASPKRENLASQLDSTVGATMALTGEIAKTTNAIREVLMGSPPSIDKTAEKPASLPGFLGNMIGRSEENNRTLNYVLDELRTVLGEIS